MNMVCDKKDKGKFWKVRARGILERVGDRIRFEELIAKACFLTADELELELCAYDASPKHPKEEDKFGIVPHIRPDGKIAISQIRLNYVLNCNAFVIKHKRRVKKGHWEYIAKRMPFAKWDGKTKLYNYPLDSVVEIPLTHPEFDRFWRRWKLWERFSYPILETYRERLEQLENRFQWHLFQPLWYCRLCKRQHQGSHRLNLAKKMGFKTIEMRIIEHFWRFDRQRSKHHRQMKEVMQKCREHEEREGLETREFVATGEEIG